jgi:hypothetical protein
VFAVFEKNKFAKYVSVTDEILDDGTKIFSTIVESRRIVLPNGINITFVLGREDYTIAIELDHKNFINVRPNPDNCYVKFENEDKIYFNSKIEFASFFTKFP